MIGSWKHGAGVCALAVVTAGSPSLAAHWADPKITPAEITAHVRYLASDELAGRGSGTPGAEKAARYIAGQFRRAGLRPGAADGSFFQPFEVVTGVTLGPENSMAVRIGKRSPETLRARDDFMPVAFSSSGKASGEVVFAGYGISQPELRHDDYRDLDARGRVVLVLRKTPGEGHRQLEPYASLRYKASVARDRGAAAVLFVTGPLSSDKEDLGRMELDGAAADSGIPALIVRRRFADRMLAPAGEDLRSVQTAIAHSGPSSLALGGVTVELRVDLKRERRQTANVIGRVDGADPALRMEAIVIGAHYDHLGMGGPESLDPSRRRAVHYGADDNASGTAGVMELAEYLAARRKRLPRTLLFIAFSGEEMGLLGSAHYVRHPVVPLSDTVAMINLDMIGRTRDNTVQVIGVGTSPIWRSLIDSIGQAQPEGERLKIRASDSGFGASDQSSFYARNIPVLFFFTGVHPDYHRPSDTWEKINAPGEAAILEFVATSVERVAAQSERPPFARAADPAPTTSPGFSVYVGSIPDYSDSTRGVALTGVREGSPAEKAGLRAGDVIVEFAGRKIANVYDYTFALRDARAGVAVEVVFLRDGKRMTATLTPAPRR